MLFQLVRSVRRSLVAVIAIAAVAAIVGAASSESRSVEYRAQAQFSLSHTPDGATLPAALARLRRKVDRVIGSRIRGAVVTLVAHPGDPTVSVLASSSSPGRASDVANLFATEMFAADRGVDRAALTRRLRRVQREIAAMPAGPQRERKRRTYERLSRRQITDSDVQAATVALRVSGPSPVHSGVVAALVAVVIAVATISALTALARRRSL